MSSSSTENMYSSNPGENPPQVVVKLNWVNNYSYLYDAK